MSMWRRRFPWPDITALCSGDEHGCEKMLDRVSGVRYVQRAENTGFFSNVMRVLPLSSLLGGDTEPFPGQRNHTTTGFWGKHPWIGKTAA